MLKVTLFTLKRHLPIESVPLLPWTLGSLSAKQETWSFFRKETFEGSGAPWLGFPANLGSLRGGARFQDLCQEGVPERLASQSGFSSIAFALSLNPLASRVCQQGALCWIKYSVLGRGAQKTTRAHLHYVFFSPLLYHIIFDKPFIYLLLLIYSWCTILCFRYTV